MSGVDNSVQDEDTCKGGLKHWGNLQWGIYNILYKVKM